MSRQIASIERDREPLGEQRLWQAVILRTIEEWKSGTLRVKRQAEQYLFEDEKDFPAVCQSAGMDVGRLRAGLRKLRDQAIQEKCAMAA